MVERQQGASEVQRSTAQPTRLPNLHKAAPTCLCSINATCPASPSPWPIIPAGQRVAAAVGRCACCARHPAAAALRPCLRGREGAALPGDPPPGTPLCRHPGGGVQRCAGPAGQGACCGAAGGGSGAQQACVGWCWVVCVLGGGLRDILPSRQVLQSPLGLVEGGSEEGRLCDSTLLALGALRAVQAGVAHRNLCPPAQLAWPVEWAEDV